MNNFSSYNQNQMLEDNLYQSNSNNQINLNSSNENLMSIADKIDLISLDSNNYNGTNLNDLSPSKYEDNNSLIKSLTKEIINNLKENKIDIYDTLSSNKYDDSDSESESLNKKKKKKKNKDKEKTLKEDLEDYIIESNPIPSTNSYLSWIFDDCFNYKDFLILFILYFILSQEMIKDFFSKYFTSLNSDHEGKVGVSGVIIYGLILTVLFMIIRKFF
jgi:hypothetical protein